MPVPIPRGSTRYSTWTTETFPHCRPPPAHNGRTRSYASPFPRTHAESTQCYLIPCQQFVFIGIAFNLNPGTARTAPHRVLNCLQLLRDILSSRAPPAVKWQCLLGHMTSLEKLTRRERLHMRSVHTSHLWSVIEPHSFSCMLYTRASSPPMVVSLGQSHLRSATSPAPARPTPVYRHLQ